MLKNYFKKYKFSMIIAVILVVIQSYTVLYQPQIISEIITELQQGTIDQQKINMLGLILIGLGVLGLIAGLVNTVIAAKVSQNIGADMREDGFGKIQELTYNDIEKFQPAKLVVRLTNDITQIQNFIMLFIQMILRIPFLLVGAFILSIMTLPGLWWTIILYIVVITALIGVMGALVGPRFAKIQKGIDDVNTSIKENIDGIRVVRSFSTEEKEIAKFDEKVENLTNDFIFTGKTFSILIPTFMFTANIVIAFAFYYVAQIAIDDPTAIGSLVSFMSYVMQLMFAIIMGGFLMMSVSRAMVSVKRVGEVLDAEPSFTYGEESESDFTSIKFDNVSFKYDDEDEDYVLRDLNFEIKKGEKIGVIGNTGSGKTTLVQLLPRLYDATKGEITIGNKNIKNFSENFLRKNISIVLQKPTIFSGDIKSILHEGDVDATKEELEQAAQKAQALEFINKKEGGFEGEVFQKGNNFSGGQKQRLSIARGFIKNSPIMILDDSTSALDAKSENLVKESLKNDFSDTTLILVAQKISSIVDMDRIIVLNEGTIESIGTHKELSENSSVYQEILSTQKGKGTHE